VVFTDRGSRPCDISNDVMKFSIVEILNDNIFEMGRPINFVFDSRVGFLGTADRMDLFPVKPDPRWRLANILKISNDDISGSGNLINFVFNSKRLLSATSKLHCLPACC